MRTLKLSDFFKVWEDVDSDLIKTLGWAGAYPGIAESNKDHGGPTLLIQFRSRGEPWYAYDTRELRNPYATNLPEDQRVPSWKGGSAILTALLEGAIVTVAEQKAGKIFTSRMDRPKGHGSVGSAFSRLVRGKCPYERVKVRA